MESSNNSVNPIPSPAEPETEIERYKREHSHFVDVYIPSIPSQHGSILLEVYNAEESFCAVPKTYKNWCYLNNFREVLVGLFDDDMFPDVLRAPTVDYLLFFAREWLPYLKTLEQTARPESRPRPQLGPVCGLSGKDFESYRRPEGEGSRFDYMYVVWWFRRVTSATGAVYQRWEQGMMREGQVRLLTIGMRMVVDQMRSLMEQGKGRDEFEIALQNGVNLITEFFGDPNYRSERLERLLLKYLGEEALNKAIAKGIEERTLEYRREGYRLLCQLDKQFPIDIYRVPSLSERTVNFIETMRVLESTMNRKIFFDPSMDPPLLFYDR